MSYKANLEASAIGNTRYKWLMYMSYWLLKYLHSDNTYRLGIVVYSKHIQVIYPTESVICS